MRAVACLAVLLGVASAWAADVVFTEPTCRQVELVASTPALDPTKGPITEKRGRAFCTAGDFPEGSGLTGPVGQRLKALLYNGGPNKLESVRIAYYTIASQELSDYVCEQYKLSPFKLSIATQNSTGVAGVAMPVADTLAACMGGDLEIRKVGCGIYDAGASCPKSDDAINTFHAKVIDIQRRDGMHDIVASSGNLNRGMIANFEDWLFFPGLTRYSKLLAQHQCMLSAFDTLTTDPSKPKSGQVYRDCLTAKNALGAEDGITSLYLPEAANTALQRIEQNFAAAESIVIATQDFRGLRFLKALEGAAERGAKIEFIVDDDWYYARPEIGLPGLTANAQEIEGVRALFLKYPQAISMRYLETNHEQEVNKTGKNVLHHKFIFFKLPTGNRRLFAGAANLTDGAFYGNAENVYWIESNQILAGYESYIERLRTRSVAESAMPAYPAPAKSHP
jgi:hypothetical protein